MFSFVKNGIYFEEEDQIMIEVRDMSNDEIDELLAKVGYCHFACAIDNQPYVVPLHYVYEKPDLYFYTTDGKKTAILRENERVCLQVEEVTDRENWKSVVVNGMAEEIGDMREREKIVEAILKKNPTLTPAISVRWLDSWVRENVEVVYRIKPTLASGRMSVKVLDRPTMVRSKKKPPM